MRSSQTADKRRKEMQRLERQRDKAERRKLRRQERAVGAGGEQEQESDVGVGEASLPSPMAAPRDGSSAPEAEPGAEAALSQMG